MAHPKTGEEFTLRFSKNECVTGFGVATTMHVPCPFCGAPEFAAYNPFDMATLGYDETMGKETTCGECGRSGKQLITQDASGIVAEFVQTAGDSPPSYLMPPPRFCPELHQA